MESANRAVPVPTNPNSLTDQFATYYEIVKILRKDCPWDNKQTNESISQLLIEETYEAIQAIQDKKMDEFAGELGDILLHVVMHAIIAEEKGAFNFIDVLQKSAKKLVHRHPHVFSTTEVEDEHDVTRNWESLKMQEGRKSILQGVPDAMPALLRAERMQYKVSRVGFDWNNKEDVWKKVEEELAELKNELDKPNNPCKMQEFGDFIFALVNAARFEDIIAEEALQYTNNKFKRRFQHIETRAKELNQNLNDMSLEEMDKLWDEAKALGL